MDNVERLYKKGDEVKSLTPFTLMMLGGENSGWSEISAEEVKAIKDAAVKAEKEAKKNPADAPSVAPNLQTAKVVNALTSVPVSQTQSGNYLPGVDSPPIYNELSKKSEGPIIGGSNNTIGISGLTGVAALDAPAPADAQSNTLKDVQVANGQTVQPDGVPEAKTQADQTKEFVDQAKAIAPEVVQPEGATVTTVEQVKTQKSGTAKVTNSTPAPESNDGK